MTEQEHSAEKDLLKLIENPSEIDAKKSPLGPADSPFAKKAKGFSRRPKLAGEKTGFSLGGFLSDRRQILRALFFATLCVLIYFVVTIVMEYRKLKNTKNLVKFTYVSEGKEASIKSVTAIPVPEEKTAEPEPAFRNIFKVQSAKKEDEKKDEVTQTLADYRLVGISLSPDAKDTYAMIKNARTNITYFLKKNEKLDNIELVQILDNKLVLKVKGKEVELR